MKEYILLLDVDGVFNVLGQTDDPIDVISCGYEKWRVKKSMLGWLYYISRQSNVKCIWLSTWQNDANVINKHIHIKDFDFTDNYLWPTNVSSTLIKKKQIQAIKEQFPNYTIISIDDDLTADEVVSDLHIKPNPATGLTVDDIIEIDELIKK
jgi:hypothetical protein